MDYFVDEQRFKSMIRELKTKKLGHDDTYKLNYFIKQWNDIRKYFNDEIYETHEDANPEGDAFLRQQEDEQRDELLEEVGVFYKHVMMPKSDRKKKPVTIKPKRKIVKRCKCK